MSDTKRLAAFIETHRACNDLIIAETDVTPDVVRLDCEGCNANIQVSIAPTETVEQEKQWCVCPGDRCTGVAPTSQCRWREARKRLCDETVEHGEDDKKYVAIGFGGYSTFDDEAEAHRWAAEEARDIASGLQQSDATVPVFTVVEEKRIKPDLGMSEKTAVEARDSGVRPGHDEKLPVNARHDGPCDGFGFNGDCSQCSGFVHRVDGSLLAVEHGDEVFIPRTETVEHGEDDIANEVYEVLKKVHAGEDPKRYTDYLLARLRRSAPREVVVGDE